MVRWQKTGSGCGLSKRRNVCDVQYDRKGKTFFLYMSPKVYMSTHFPRTSTGPAQFRGRKGIRVTKVRSMFED